MTVLNSYKIALALVLLVGSTNAIAQKGATDEPVSAGSDESVNKEWKPSLIKDGSYDRVEHVGLAVPWQRIREADVLWKKRVWREIDVREKQNIGFRYQGDENTGGGMFIEILIDAIKRGKITAYATTDDRFTTKLTKDQVMESLAAADDTVTSEDPVTGEVSKKIIHNDFHPDEVTRFRLKEDWIFDRNQGKMVVRIVGLAPVKDFYLDGVYRGPVPMFWLSYPDIRQVLSSYEVYNPNNDVYRYTWDEFFESRQFSSKITKVSNSLNQRYEDIFGSDARGKMEALYESQQNANEIFNKEHDMWVY